MTINLNQFFRNRYKSYPTDWPFFRLGDLFKERQEKSADTVRYPLYSLLINGGVVPKPEKYDRSFLQKDEDNNEYKLVYEGDFVFNPMNLRYGAIAVSRAPFIVAVSGYYNVLTLIHQEVNIKYLEALLLSGFMIDLYDRLSIGSLIEKRRVHLSIFENIIIPLPSLSEQSRIAAILSTWDKAIVLTERLIVTLQERKKGLMQRLLSGEVRFPEFKGNWREITLGEVFRERVERNYSALPLLSITEDGITYRDEQDRRDTSNEDKSKYLRICSGDIGYNTMRMWQGRSALSQLEGIVSPAYTILIPDKSVDGRYMAYLFKYQPMVFTFCRYSQGLVSDTWSLKYPIFSTIKVKIPELAEQKRIADLLELCDLEIKRTQEYLETLQQQKKGLTQRLLTGEVRVKVD